MQQWALEDPSWVPWAVPSPVRKTDTEGLSKVKKRARAEMHQRVRDRLPHLPVLVEAADRHRRYQSELLDVAARTASGESFVHQDVTYRRVVPKTNLHAAATQRGPDYVHAENLSSGARLNLTLLEDQAFWPWAIIETLRHTGVRIEELLEVTHLALVSYTLPDTGEVVPLLQIVPSKTDTERLLLISPELASVLATVVTRIRDHAGRVPLVSRYDPHERTTGPMLPHLFQRSLGWRRESISTTTAQRFLNDTLARAGLTDATGVPLRYTAHDFRRMFATEAVTGGLPVHIAAKILGHESINTTQSYLAVFQTELIRAYRTFLSQRRALRPSAEYREPTEAEWDEFLRHFTLRKLELGTCGRPYGTPCNHEHACIRCPMLRLDPAQRPRLVVIIDNLQARITEARSNGWLGEVQALQVSLDAAQAKLTNLDRLTSTGPTNLGIPTLRGPDRDPATRS